MSESNILTVSEHWGVDWKRRVSQYFTLGEVCQWDPEREVKDPSVKRNILTLARHLDVIRREWGEPIIVTSWYRPPEVNRRVGGVPNSQHLNGSAADIRPASSRGRDFEQWLDVGLWKDRALGYGQRAGRGFTHIDLRPGRIRWNY